MDIFLRERVAGCGFGGIGRLLHALADYSFAVHILGRLHPHGEHGVNDCGLDLELFVLACFAQFLDDVGEVRNTAALFLVCR